VIQRVKKRMSLRSKVYVPVEQGLEQNEAGKFERKEGKKTLNVLSFVITDFLGLSESGSSSKHFHKEVLLLSGAAGNDVNDQEYVDVEVGDEIDSDNVASDNDDDGDGDDDTIGDDVDVDDDDNNDDDGVDTIVASDVVAVVDAADNYDDEGDDGDDGVHDADDDDEEDDDSDIDDDDDDDDDGDGDGDDDDNVSDDA